LDTQSVIRDDDATFYEHEGNPVPVALTVSAIIDHDQSVGAVMVFRDITDRKNLEIERARTQTEREALEAQMHQSQRLESLGQLAGGIAHDFNNLLGVISNYATFVAEKVSDAATHPGGEHWQEASQDIEQIEQAAHRAAGLTHQLLAFARREIVQPRVLNLNQLVTGVEGLLSRTLGEHVTLRTTLAAGLGPVIADPGQIEQVLLNLAINARDAMPHGGSLVIDTADVDIDELPVGSESDLTSGRYARLRVSDTGTGIPKHLIDRVFEPFFTTKAKGEGTGLGLATVYGIISQAGGILKIHSQPDVGTTFTILLPVTDQQPDDRMRPTPRRNLSTGETVLLVEDEDALRDVTHRLLHRNGYRVLAAATGEAALGIAASHPEHIDVLLTDLIMPHMLGKELAERLIALRPTTRVLYMSGYAQPILTAQGHLETGVALLEKPFSQSSLVDKLHEVLDRSALPTILPELRTSRPNETDANMRHSEVVAQRVTNK
jgi:signal transduction histidine kinase/CheY-like chemotaxis protein